MHLPRMMPFPPHAPSVPIAMRWLGSCDRRCCAISVIQVWTMDWEDASRQPEITDNEVPARGAGDQNVCNKGRVANCTIIYIFSNIYTATRSTLGPRHGVHTWAAGFVEHIPTQYGRVVCVQAARGNEAWTKKSQCEPPSTGGDTTEGTRRRIKAYI